MQNAWGKDDLAFAKRFFGTAVLNQNRFSKVILKIKPTLPMSNTIPKAQKLNQ